MSRSSSFLLKSSSKCRQHNADFWLFVFRKNSRMTNGRRCSWRPTGAAPASLIPVVAVVFHLQFVGYHNKRIFIYLFILQYLVTYLWNSPNIRRLYSFPTNICLNAPRRINPRPMYDCTIGYAQWYSCCMPACCVWCSWNLRFIDCQDLPVRLYALPSPPTCAC